MIRYISIYYVSGTTTNCITLSAGKQGRNYVLSEQISRHEIIEERELLQQKYSTCGIHLELMQGPDSFHVNQELRIKRKLGVYEVDHVVCYLYAFVYKKVIKRSLLI